MKLTDDIRVLVVDDSAANRRAISETLSQAPGIQVVDRAADGEEGLKKAITLKPDVITLDLEMPRLDGFAFLRLLMAKLPTPVVVLSSYGHPSDVFKAMQLGAVDFVAKPAGPGSEAFARVRAELVEKVRSVRSVRPAPARPSPPMRPSRTPPRKGVPTSSVATHVLAVGASTGGPPALQRLLEGLGRAPVSVVVAQHMPARFTHAFAQRLHQVLPFEVAEAKDGDQLVPGRVLVAPGGAQLEVVLHEGRLVASVTGASPYDRFAPSVDRLFASVANAVGRAAVGVVLTGMGNDGAAGAKALQAAGARVWAEAEESAAVFSMPAAAIATGAVDRVLPLDAIAPAVAAHFLSPPVASP
jgi:two-component system, chemotaxis family, protein-glutamate methylesterase/glutaminase